MNISLTLTNPFGVIAGYQNFSEFMFIILGYWY